MEAISWIKQQNVQLVYAEMAQLLLIVSDGRGLFLEGKERVLAAVQAARSANVFVIFVVLDNPNSRVSEREHNLFVTV